MSRRLIIYVLLCALLLVLTISGLHGWLEHQRLHRSLTQQVESIQAHGVPWLNAVRAQPNPLNLSRALEHLLNSSSGLSQLAIQVEGQALIAVGTAVAADHQQTWVLPLDAVPTPAQLLLTADRQQLLQTAIGRALQALLALGLATLLLSLLLAWLVEKLVGQPLLVITRYAENYNPEVKDQGLVLPGRPPRDELARLAAAINQMRAQLRDAYEEIRKSEERFELALHATHEGVYDWDLESNSVYFSNQWKRMCGHEPAEIGNHANEWFERVHPDDIHQVMADVKAHLDKTKPFYDNIHRLRHKNQAYLWVHARGIAVWDEQGDPYRMVGTSRDISEQRRAEEALRESERFTRTLIEESPVGLVLTRMDGAIVELNSAYAAIIGRQQEDTKKLDYWAITPSAYAEAEQAQMQQLLHEGRFGPYEKEYIHREGYLVPVRVCGLIIEKSGERFIWASVEDITLQRRSEETLRRAKQMAESANLAKSQFIANMSHELRTPLNAIIGYSEMLREDSEDLGLPDFGGDLHKILGSARHLLGLINDVLDISKIEAGKMEIFNEIFDLNDMVNEVVDTVKPMVAHTGCTLHADYPQNLGRIYADLTKVRQILLNLLSNAVKFTEQGAVRLSVQRQPDADGKLAEGWIVIQVSDEGIGMTHEQLQKLFQPFTQADASTTRKYGGTGLGLVITKRFTEMMQGHIEVNSDFGHGSQFTVYLPAHLPDVLPVHEPVKTASESTLDERSIVLVIDDDPAVRDVLKNYISKLGYRVATATGGDEGLRLARKLKPSAITLDVMMPGMDGWMVLSALKTDPLLADIPVIMASIIEDKALGYSLGAADYLIKPISPEQLRVVLGRYRNDDDARYLVMVVEDDHITRGMMEVMLNRSGWEVCSAENGARGLEVLAQRETAGDPLPNLILLDLMMPEMDGFTFVNHLHQHPRWSQIPVVVLTAKDITLEDRARLRSGVQTIFQKGAYKRDDLLAEIREQLARLPSPDLPLLPHPGH